VPGSPTLDDLVGRGAAGHPSAEAVEAAGAPLRGGVPPVAVEGLAALEVEAVDVLRPAFPALGADVPDVDDLGPAAATLGADVERSLQALHLRHALDRVLPEVLHVVVLALPDDVDDLVEVQASVRHRWIPLVT
jgi:hypothetical protein